MAPVLVPPLAMLCLVLGIIPLLHAYNSLRKSDPEHALKRTAGLGVLSLGSIAMTIAFVTLRAVLLQEDQPLIKVEVWMGGNSHETRNGVDLGPAGLSIWMLIAGSVVGLGLLLFLRRFSLRCMLIVLSLVALAASIPQLLVKSRSQQGTIAVQFMGLLTEVEWQKIKPKLSKQWLCQDLPSEITNQLPVSPEEAIATLTVERVQDEGGRTVAHLALFFEGELTGQQVELLVLNLSERAQAVIPKPPRPLTDLYE